MKESKAGSTAAWKLLLAGALTGLINGFFGGGGGIAAVVLLKRAGLETKKAHAGAVACILPLCVISGGIYLFTGRVSLTEVLPYIPGGLAGALIGTALLRRLDARWLELIFPLLLIVMGVRLLNG